MKKLLTWTKNDVRVKQGYKAKCIHLDVARENKQLKNKADEEALGIEIDFTASNTTRIMLSLKESLLRFGEWF